jgi:glycosyltransferase involved in cell wall biosynthesis
VVDVQMEASGRSVLMVAFQFPPFAGSSGVQRTLRFAKYLPRYGWKPIVLTVDARAYSSTSNSAGNEVPKDLIVHRALGLDVGRHLSIAGRYPGWLAIPDRWATWRWFAVRAARSLIRKHGVSVVWSTFPIATAHSIGRQVARSTGLPWVAEFRDPMWQGEYPYDSRVNAAWKKLEISTFAAAARVVVTTPGARRLYLSRFPEFRPDCIDVIQNGYDEETFQRAGHRTEVVGSVFPSGVGRKITLLHSGVIYLEERDPSQLFSALAALKSRRSISRDDFCLVLRASGNEKVLREMLIKHDIEDVVSLQPATSYQDAIREMMDVDGLLVLQAPSCNAQIPAKLYEYLRARRPILALTDPAGDTAQALYACGVGSIAQLNSQSEIEVALLDFLGRIKSGTAAVADERWVANFSREKLSADMADVLDQVASRHGQKNR